MVLVVPTMILVGIVLGLLPVRDTNRVPVIAVGTALASIGWGLVVGVPVGGTVVGLANVLVGLLLGLGLFTVARSALRRPTH